MEKTIFPEKWIKLAKFEDSKKQAIKRAKSKNKEVK